MSGPQKYSQDLDNRKQHHCAKVSFFQLILKFQTSETPSTAMAQITWLRFFGAMH